MMTYAGRRDSLLSLGSACVRGCAPQLPPQEGVVREYSIQKVDHNAEDPTPPGGPSDEDKRPIAHR